MNRRNRAFTEGEKRKEGGGGKKRVGRMKNCRKRLNSTRK